VVSGKIPGWWGGRCWCDRSWWGGGWWGGSGLVWVWWGGVRGVGGVQGGDEVGDGQGGVFGEDGADGDLVVLLVVDGLDVECVQESGDQFLRGLCEQFGGEVGELV
jgi:hypothetical protein